MAFLSDYYKGQAGAGWLDSRDRDALISRGEPLRYGVGDPFTSDRDIAEIRAKGGTMLIPNEQTGQYSAIRPDAGVLPGGDRVISQQELVARGRNAAAGGRPLDDPYGVYARAELDQQRAGTLAAMKTAEYLGQFMSPDKIPAEVKRLTGYSLPGGVETTPSILARRKEEAEISGKRAGTEKTEVETRAAKTKLFGEQQTLQDEPGLQRHALDQMNDTFDRVREGAAEIRNDPMFSYAFGMAGKAGTKINEITGMETPAARINTKLEMVRGQVALQAMAQLKALSSTGATGFGALSAPELALLENSIVNLKQAQGEEAIKKSLLALEREMETAKIRANTRYYQKYGERAIESTSPPRAFPGPQAASAGQVYMTKRGPMKWTGTGFLPVKGTANVGSTGSW